MKTKRKALRSLTAEKVVNISDYRTLKMGRSFRRLAVVSQDLQMVQGLEKQLAPQTEVVGFDSRFSLEQGLKNGEWDGVVLDERSLHEDAFSLCEKLKKTTKFEELFVVILSNDETKEVVRRGYEFGCDEWITRTDDIPHLARLLDHHLAS